jgi:hypothetical protein
MYKKILVTGIPRSGTTAYCSTLLNNKVVENNFGEIFNVADLMIPYDSYSGKPIHEVCSQFFNNALDNGNWEQAWNLRPIGNYRYRPWPLTGNRADFQKSPINTLQDFLNQYQNRFNKIKNVSSWCIKIFDYHHVPIELLDQIKSMVNEIHIIFRKNKTNQALSTVIRNQSYESNTTENVNPKKYNITESSVISTLRYIFKAEKKILEVYPNAKILYYEDLIFNTDYKKLNNFSTLILDNVKKIEKELWN